MDPLQDDQIQAVAISVEPPVEVLPNERPDKFQDLPDGVIRSFSSYMQVVLQMSEQTKHQEEINVRRTLENAKNMFRDGAKYHDDLWMQHVAASIREVVGFLDITGEDFYKAHSNIPPYATDPVIKQQLDRVISIRSYLSDIVHFVPGNRFGIVQRLFPGSPYSTMRKDVFFRDEEGTLEKVCIDLVYTLNDIFVKYCIGVVPAPAPVDEVPQPGITTEQV